MREAAGGYTLSAFVAISVTVEVEEKRTAEIAVLLDLLRGIASDTRELSACVGWPGDKPTTQRQNLREDQSSLSEISSCGVEISGSRGA